MDEDFLKDIVLLAAAGIAGVAFFFIKAYLAKISDEITDLRKEMIDQGILAIKRFDTAIEKIDCRINSIEINLAVKSNTLDHCVREMCEIKEKLKDLESVGY